MESRYGEVNDIFQNLIIHENVNIIIDNKLSFFVVSKGDVGSSHCMKGVMDVFADC
jgi:hypothetical protein